MPSSSALANRFKLIFFVPPQFLPQCKEAIFATGAGSFPGGKYTQTCFVTPGVAQFKPSVAANPTIGTPGKLEEVGEVKCEILCVGADITERAVEALKKTHPYEEVAYEVYKLEPF